MTLIEMTVPASEADIGGLKAGGYIEAHMQPGSVLEHPDIETRRY